MHKSAQGKTQNGILHSIIPPKVVSKPDPATGFFNPFPSYPYTGALRPVYPLSPKRTVPKSIPHPDYAETGIPKGARLINRNKFEILDAKSQEGMRKVCKLAREVLDIVAAELKPGITTDYLDEVCHKACIERNVSRSLLSGGQESELIPLRSPTLLLSTTTTSPSPFVRRRTRSSATAFRISASSWTATLSTST